MKIKYLNALIASFFLFPGCANNGKESIGNMPKLFTPKYNTYLLKENERINQRCERFEVTSDIVSCFGNAVRDRITRKIIIADAFEKKTMEVTIWVHADGRIQKAYFERASNNDKFNRHVYDILNRISPIPVPLDPDIFANNFDEIKLDINL